MTVDAQQFVRDAYAAWNRGDLEGFMAFLAPDVVLRPSGVFPDLAEEYVGHEGIRRFWRDVREPWQELAIDVDLVEEHGGDLIFIGFRYRARARDGMAVDARFFQVGELRGGLAARIEAYADEAEARNRLEARLAG